MNISYKKVRIILFVVISLIVGFWLTLGALLSGFTVGGPVRQSEYTLFFYYFSFPGGKILALLILFVFHFFVMFFFLRFIFYLIRKIVERSKFSKRKNLNRYVLLVIVVNLLFFWFLYFLLKSLNYL